LPRTIRITIAYDGTDFAGWQFQTGQRTVQAELEAALKRITGEDIRAVASGRTDSGVHAYGQVVGFRTESALSAYVFGRALAAELPRDLVIVDAREASEDFHAIRDVITKRYRYVINDGPVPNVFARAYCWQVRRRLDAERMHRAAQAWVGQHDFSSFEASGSPRVSAVRTVTEFAVHRREPDEPDAIWFEVEADGFLYNMVRTMVGTLIEIGRGVRPEEWTAEVLASANRRVAGITVPPQGLFLMRVHYADPVADLNKPVVLG
jgi:tRNA pseudouridine38-40 synthase